MLDCSCVLWLQVSRSPGGVLDTKIGSAYLELTVGVCERIAELLVLGAERVDSLVR